MYTEGNFISQWRECDPNLMIFPNLASWIIKFSDNWDPMYGSSELVELKFVLDNCA